VDKIYILYTCDEWKSRDSMRVSEATTDKDTMYAIIANNIFKGEMEYEGLKNHAGLLDFKTDYDCNQVDFGKLSHGFVEEFENENVRESQAITDYTMASDWLNMDIDDLRDTMNFGNPDPVSEQNEDEEDLEQ